MDKSFSNLLVTDTQNLLVTCLLYIRIFHEEANGIEIEDLGRFDEWPTVYHKFKLAL